MGEYTGTLSVVTPQHPSPAEQHYNTAVRSAVFVSRVRETNNGLSTFFMHLFPQTYSRVGLAASLLILFPPHLQREGGEPRHSHATPRMAAVVYIYCTALRYREASLHPSSLEAHVPLFPPHSCATIACERLRSKIVDPHLSLLCLTTPKDRPPPRKLKNGGKRGGGSAPEIVRPAALPCSSASRASSAKVP